VVVRTAQSLVRHGLATPQATGEAEAARVPGSAPRKPRTRRPMPQPDPGPAD
jgi:hypothetical protein